MPTLPWSCLLSRYKLSSLSLSLARSHLGTDCVTLQVLMKYMEMMGQDTDFVNNLVKV